MLLSDPQLVQIVAVTAAAIGFLAKTIYELVRTLRHERHGGDAEGSLSRLAGSITAVIESHGQREERLIERLVELENQETAALGRMEYHLASTSENLRALAERLDRHGEDIRRLTERVGWQGLAAVRG